MSERTRERCIVCADPLGSGEHTYCDRHAALADYLAPSAPDVPRTQCPGDFPLAIAAVDDVLAEYHTHKGASWREKSPRHHNEHALMHAQAADALLWSPGAGDVREHLTHAATRALMALELYEQENGR